MKLQATKNIVGCLCHVNVKQNLTQIKTNKKHPCHISSASS